MIAVYAPLTPSQIAYLAEVLPPLPDRTGMAHRDRCECLPCRSRKAIQKRPRNQRWRRRHGIPERRAS